MNKQRAHTVAEKIIRDHLEAGDMRPGAEIGLRIDQTLTQDATGTLVMLELEAMELDRVKTDVSVQYVDHNMLQTDFKNPDDHLFLHSACQKYGVWYSRPGNGVSHPVHQERFGVPGKTLAGSDSHTPAAGGIGMLAVGAGGLDVAFAMAGEPMYLKMPEIWGIRLTGELPEWVSAKDVILELLRRHDVDGGVGTILEYFGPGVDSLSAMDRHVICNMGTELGATTSIFPSDKQVRRFLARQGRESDWRELKADSGAEYDRTEELDLSELEPLIALPSSPGNVVPVREVAGRPIYQAYVGSSANPGMRDFWVPAEMVDGRSVPDQISFDINPTSRQMLENLTDRGALRKLLHAGARLHQAGCNGCIGMGQAPATDQISLRTVPRNFPGRSGTKEDNVYLCSPETATASALAGEIIDPRTWAEREGVTYPEYSPPEQEIINREMLLAPPTDGSTIELQKGPNVKSIPELTPLPDEIALPVLLKMGDDISTDEILRAGSEVLPYRSNIPKIAEWSFEILDESYYARACEAQEEDGGHVVVAGDNYAQGSSREHAALAPRYLGQRAVLAKSYARIGWQNLVNYGILPLQFADADDYESLEQGDRIRIRDLRRSMQSGEVITVENVTQEVSFDVVHSLSSRQVEIMLAGGRIPWFRENEANS